MSQAAVVNGRFRHLEPGGFRRYAERVSSELHHVTELKPPPGWSTGWRGRAWEQTELRRQAGSSLLLNLTGSGPARRTHQVCVIQDIIPITNPEWCSARYARLFRQSTASVTHSSRMIVTPSSVVAEQMVDHFSVDSDRLTIIPPGVDDHYSTTAVDVPAPAELELETDRPLVLGLNSAVPRKNGRATIGVLAEIKRRRPEVVVAVVGHDGPSRVFGSAQRPCSDRVVDLGSVSDDLLTALLQRTSVFVSMSLAEGFGMTPLEAAACGAAVVSTAVPSVCEYPPADLAIVDPHDIDAAACAVESFLDRRSVTAGEIDPALRWSAIGQKFRTLINDIT